MAFSTTPSTGNDRLRATADDQTINALAGDDWIRSIFNASTLFGGNGHDRITVALSVLEPTATDNFRTAALFGGNGNDWLTTELVGHVTEEFQFNFTVQQSGGRGNDNLYVSATSTTDTGYSTGSFVVDLAGGAGDDSIWIESDGVAGASSNLVDAGSGSDVVYIYAGGNFFGGGGSNEVFAGAGDDEVLARSYSSFSIVGDNVLWGGEGDDRLEAMLDGVGGRNELHGEDGDDILIAIGDAADDASSFMANIVSGGAGDDTIRLEGASAGAFTSVRNEARGDEGDDRITSIATLGGDSGEASSGMGETILYGGTGNDSLTATTRYNVEDEELGGSTLYGGDGNDTLRVYGGVENTLNGGAGDDTITGGSGADRIIGGSGADQLRGGGGEDAFFYLWMTGGNAATRDTILSFGEDVIDLSAIDANANRGGNQAFLFGGGTGVGRVWVEDSTTGSGSILRANNGGAEMLYIAVEDGADRDASDWSADDFLL